MPTKIVGIISFHKNGGNYEKSMLLNMSHEEYNLRKRAVEMAYCENKLDTSTKLIMKLVDMCPIVFRFRPPFDYELDTLETSQIFLCRASKFEDLGDCRMIFDHSDFAKYLMDVKKPEMYKYLPPDVKSNALKMVPKNIENNEKFKALIEENRGSPLVACFSNNYSEEMWYEYADNGKGFCVVYDIKEIVLGVKGLTFCPVRYVENRELCKDIVFTSEEYSDSKDSFYKFCKKYCLSCMTKDIKPYSKEGEWRLIQFESDLDESQGGELKPFIKPLYIIEGKDISANPDFKYSLENIANNLNLQVYSHSKISEILQYHNC